MNNDLNWEILKDCIRYGKVLTDRSYEDYNGNCYRQRTFVHPSGMHFFISMCNGEINYLRKEG